MFYSDIVVFLYYQETNGMTAKVVLNMETVDIGHGGQQGVVLYGQQGGGGRGLLLQGFGGVGQHSPVIQHGEVQCKQGGQGKV